MKYYVLREEQRVVRGNEETVTYDPRHALMVCDDLVAAEKYFRYCVNKKNIRCILTAESLFSPASNQTLRSIFLQTNEGSSGFVTLASTIRHPNVVDKLEVTDHVGKYMLENCKGDNAVVRMTGIELYTQYENFCGSIVGEIVKHISSNGSRKKVLRNIKHYTRVNMVPFTVVYHR